MTTLTLLLLAAALAYGLAKLLHLPAIPLLVLCGWGLGMLLPDLPENLLANILELGLIFLVFIAGVELNPRRVRKHVRGVVIVGTVQFVALGILGYGFARLLNYPPGSALFMAFALSASSTLVVIRCLKQRQQMFEPFGRLVTGVLLLQDLLIVTGLIVLIHLPEGGIAVAIALTKGAVLGVLAWCAHRWIIPFLVLRCNPDEELLLLIVLSLLFAFAGGAWLLDLPLVAGAFLGGFALSSFPVNGVVRGLLLSLGDFFLGIFFLVLGALIVLPDLDMLVKTAAFTVFILVVTVPVVTLIAEKCGYSARASIESGLLLSQTSEFSLIVALYGWMMGHIAVETFSVIALMTVITMTLTPFIATDQNTWRVMRLHPTRFRSQSVPPDLEDHILIIGFGSAGESILRLLKDQPRSMVIIDDDAAVIARLRERGYYCLQGDGSDDQILDLAHARRSTAIVSSMRRVADTTNILRHLKGTEVPLVVRVLDPMAAEQLSRAGAHTIVMVEPTAEIFLDWFESNFAPKQQS